MIMLIDKTVNRDVEKRLETPLYKNRSEAHKYDNYTHNVVKRRSKFKKRSKFRKQSKSRKRSKSRSRKRSRRRRRRSRSRSHKRSRSRTHKSHRKPVNRDVRKDKKSVSRDSRKDKKSVSRDGRKDKLPREPQSSPDQLTEEEKDARTIYIWQLSLRVKTGDLEDFFAPLGRMDVVRLVKENKTGKSRGVAFIQFRSLDSVNRALDFNGQKLLGVPMQIRTVTSERCRVAASRNMGGSLHHFRGPTKLCISNLHVHITEQMLEDIFSPYGKIDELRLMRDDHGASLSTAFVLFRDGEHARNVIEHMNDFSLAGQLLKVTLVIEETDQSEHSENEHELVTPAARLELKAMHGSSSTPIVNSQCFVLSNMFDPDDVDDYRFCKEVRDDIVCECDQFGGVCHLYVDKKSLSGEVYVKCPSIYVANKCVGILRGRSFDGRLITANFIPLEYYHKMFPESVSAKKLLRVEV